MQTPMSGRPSFPRTRLRRVLAAGVSLLLAMAVSGTALAQTQRIPVTGTVTSAGGAPLQGVLVRVEGTDTTTLTNANGRYSITAPADGFLTFTLLGQRPVRTAVGGRTTIDVRMERIAYLEEVVVTAYSEAQRRADITGAVSSVNTEAIQRQTSASVLQRLDANVSGVTVEASGSPASRSTVRIRGISSFQNNDPLYIIDGTPVTDTYINWLNPNDIESIQVLKDASAASIYGSRASNGVVIIETTKRESGPPRATLRARTGIATPVRGYDDFLILDALDYHEIVRRAYVNAKQAVPTNIYGDPNSPSVPAYIWPNNCGPRTPAGAPTPGPCSDVDVSSYAFPNNLIMPGSRGTNWWKEVFGSAMVGDYNLDVAGGSRDNSYAVSFNFFDQEGTAAYNRFNRGSVRVNTAFNRGRFNFGENIAIAVERGVGGLSADPGGFAEGGILGKNILMQPVVPVRDVAGNFASGKAVGLGNQTNPLKVAWAARENISRNDRIFGNVFAGFDATDELQLRTRFGFNLGRGSFSGFNPMFPENSEATFTNSINENRNHFTDWTWSNTLRYGREFSRHNVSLLLGQEANVSDSRYIEGSMANVITEDPSSWYLQDALGDAGTKNVLSTGGKSALLSFFGKADYSFADRYVLSLTLRRDGSSNLGPDNRWGTFPAVGLGWRVSQEPFFPQGGPVSDLMLRFGWGITGNQQIPSGRIVSAYGGSRGDTFYDIAGTNTNLIAGVRQTRFGNRDLRWEESRSINAGMDLSLLDGRIDIVADVYQRETSNLLFDPPIPGTAGVANPPIVNIGQMQNRGIDFSIGHRAASWNVTLNASHYRNKIVRIAGTQDFFYGPISTRFGNQIINQVGEPIGSFYGYIAEGFFRDAADVAAHPKQDGAAPGRIKFRDMNGDGQVTLADRTIIGSPHPDFTAGLDMGARWRAFDVSATVFGTFGNDIFDVQKEFYVFRNFSTNVRRDLLTNSWEPVDPSVPRDQYVAKNPNAKYPILDQNDNFSRALSSFYVEDGSYVRLRNLQVGYTIPTSFARWLSAARVYLQAENLFTITGYEGLDPALPAANVFGPAGDIRDQYRGVDRGTYPSSRTFSVGIVTSF